ncbi:MAG: hypothetical protein Q9169_002467 [Polycauliona sp. 2 TL-2023]
MWDVLVYGVTVMLLALLGVYNHEAIFNTLPAGVDHSFSNTTTSWINPFANISFIDLADDSVALFADHIIPALIPGSTGTGRPYVVDSASLAVTAVNDTTLSMSDHLVYVKMLRASMARADREPFMEAHVIRGLLLVLFVFFVVVLGGSLCIRSYIRSVSRVMRLEVAELGNTTAQNTPVLGYLERLFNLTSSKDLKIREPLRLLGSETRKADQTPYVPSLTAHIDFVLETIDSANDKYEASIQAKKLLDAQTAEYQKVVDKYDDLLVTCQNLRLQLAEKIEDLENGDRTVKEITVSRRQLQDALDAKNVTFDEVTGKLVTSNKSLRDSQAQHRSLRDNLDEKTKGHDALVKQLAQANTKCTNLETDLTSVRGDLQGANNRCGQLEMKLKVANDRWDAFYSGPSGIEGIFTMFAFAFHPLTYIPDASNTPLPDPIDGEMDAPKPVPSSTAANAPSTSGFNPAAQDFRPVRYPPSAPSQSPARWRTDKQAKEVHDQLIALQRAQLPDLFPASGRSLPSMPRRNSMGSVSNAAASFPPGPFTALGPRYTPSGPKPANGNVMDNAKPSPTPSKEGFGKPAVSPVPVTPNSAGPSTDPTAPGRDFSAPESADPRGRPSGTSTPPPEPRSRTPTTVQRLGDRRPVSSSQAARPADSRGSPIRNSGGSIIGDSDRSIIGDSVSARGARNGLGDASPAPYRGGYNSQSARAGGRGGFTPSYRGGGDSSRGGYSSSPRGRGRGRGWNGVRDDYIMKDGRDIRNDHSQSDYMRDLLNEALPGMKNGPPIS